MTADSVKLAYVERLIGTGGAVIVSMQHVYLLCLLVLVFDSLLDTDEVKADGSETGPLLGSNIFSSTGRIPSAASEQNKEI